MIESGDPNPRYLSNPSLLTYLIAAELLIARVLGPLAGPFAPEVPAVANLLARLSSALLGTASVALVFALGARLFGRWVGLLAALFLAASFLHVRDSHYGVSDVPAIALLLVSLYFMARLLEKPALRWYVLAGLAGGLATSTKYNMGFFFVPLLAAHWLALRRLPRRERRRMTLRPLIVAGASALAGFFITTPYVLLDLQNFQEDVLAKYSQYGNIRKLGQPIEPVPLLYLTSLLQGFGLLPLVLAAAGLVFAWRKQRPVAVLLLAFPAAYLALMLPKARFFPRFALPLLPFLSLLAAYGAFKLADWLRQASARWRVGDYDLGSGDSMRVIRTTMLVGLVVAAIVQPLANSVLHNRLLLQADTRVLANEWAQANLAPGSRLKTEEYSLRDMSSQERIHTPNTAGLTIEHLRAMPEARQASYLLEENVQYAVTSSFAHERCLMAPLLRFQERTGICAERVYTSVLQRSELVASFSPGHGGQELPWRMDDIFTPYWSLGEYERPGPTIRIYSISGLAPAAGL
jgi:uncharacterized membrane protein